MSELELADQIIRHALELQRLSAHEEQEALAIMRELEQELRQLLATTELADAKRREVESLIRDANRAIAAKYGEIPGLLDTERLMMTVADRTVSTLETVMIASAPSAARIASLAKDVLIDGAPSSAWWARQSETLAWKFAAEVRQGVLLDETQEQIVARIVGRGDEIGIMDKARRDVRALVHSSVMTAANRARLETYRKNGRRIAGVRWLATLDGHTCMTCMALDGSKWDLDGKPLGDTDLDFQVPPAHWNCRCVASPIPKGIDEIFGTTGLDARMSDGPRATAQGPQQVAGFGDFLRRQSPEFVEEMLGVRRAELWQAGEITLRDLVSGSGRPLTLDELAVR